MSPLVSIIIATYRRAPELERAILSAVNQTYDNCEIIVVDDNADIVWNRKIQQIVRKCTTEITNIKLIQNSSNQGSAKTRNIGFEASAGDYIVFLDDDDVYFPDRVRAQLQVMLDSDADYGITDIILYNENESVNEIRKREYLITEGRDNLLLCHLKYHLTGTDTLMFKREYLKKIEGFDLIDSGDEYYLMMKAILNNGKISYLPQCDVKAYVHVGDGGLSSGEGKIAGEKKLYSYKRNYFKKLKFKDRQYITMRHYAVLAFAYLRMNKLLQFLANGLIGFFMSPVGCIKLLKSRKR